MSANAPHYVIRGGRQGRERLRMLARVMWPDDAPVAGTARASRGALPRRRLRWWRRDARAGSARTCRARVVGVDVDDVKLDLARGEAEAESVQRRVPSRRCARAGVDGGAVRRRLRAVPALAPSRPEQAVAHLAARLAPGGVMVVEDVDCSGQFCSPATRPSRDSSISTAPRCERRGADPEHRPPAPGNVAGRRSCRRRVRRRAAGGHGR